MNEITFLVNELDIQGSNGMMIDEFNESMKTLGVSISTHPSNDEKIKFSVIKINFDTQKINQVLSRNAGRPVSVIDSYHTVSEIRKRLHTETAEEIAESLGISRSTLFRKLKKAEQNGYTILH